MSRIPRKPKPRFRIGEHVFFDTDIGVGEGTISAITYADLGDGVQVCTYWINGSDRKFNDGEDEGGEDVIFKTWIKAWRKPVNKAR